jgi:hypothetical protein
MKERDAWIIFAAAACAADGDVSVEDSAKFADGLLGELRKRLDEGAFADEEQVFTLKEDS